MNTYVMDDEKPALDPNEQYLEKLIIGLELKMNKKL